MERSVHINVLDQIVCIRLDVSIWSGQKKLTSEDLGLTPDQIPPEELANLGRKRICDPKELAIFRAIKKRGERELQAHGVRFLDGYAVPTRDMARINDELDNLGQEFQSARTEFIANYEDSVEAWIARHSEWEDQLRRAIEPVERIAGALTWRRTCYRVVHPSSSVPDTGLATEVNGLGGQLLREVAQEAKEAWEQSYQDKLDVTRRALWPLNRIYKKMLSLSFLEPRIKPFLNLMARVIKQADQSGPGRIQGQELSELQKLLHILMSPTKVLAGGYPVVQTDEVLLPDPAEISPEPLFDEATPDDSDTEPDTGPGAVQPEMQTDLAEPPAWFF